MIKFSTIFILLNAIIPLIFTSCPDYPTIPTTSPPLITPASEGMRKFPSSTQQLSISMFITPKEKCTAGTTFNLFSMNFGAAPEYFTIYIVCSSLKVYKKGSQLTPTPYSYNIFSSPDLGPVGLYLSFDLDAGTMNIALQSDIWVSTVKQTFPFTTNSYFDSNSQFYFCADKDGASAKACTISNLVFEYRYDTDNPLYYGHLAGTDPAIVAFYPLADGSLATSFGSAASAYFGDSEDNPTPGTSPTWDSSNAFITITSGQFLTIPLPDLSSTIPTLSSSFSFAAWVKITEIPSSPASIFSMYSADGTKLVGYQLTVSQSPNQLKLSFAGSSSSTIGTAPTVTLNQWQLIGFSAFFQKSVQRTIGTAFVGSSWYQINTNTATPFDPSAAYVIRIGDKTALISGQISVARITTPGGGYIKTTDPCSSDNSLELGVGSFSLACSGSNYLNIADNECLPTCPSGTRATSDTPVPLCVPCPKSNCDTCNSVQCLVCLTNSLFYQGECIRSCPGKMYYDGLTCQSCSPNCATCDPECLTCDANYLLYKGSCVGTCPARFYSNLISCIACSDNCADCEADGCKACDDGYQLNSDKKCVLSRTTNAKTRKESGLSGVIAGIVCGGFIFLLFIAVLGRRYLKNKNDSKRVSKLKSSEFQTSQDLKAITVSPIHSETNPLMP